MYVLMEYNFCHLRLRSLIIKLLYEVDNQVVVSYRSSVERTANNSATSNLHLVPAFAY
jgi:hypothetical protein